jgi:hypothetical protein
MHRALAPLQYFTCFTGTNALYLLYWYKRTCFCIFIRACTERLRRCSLLALLVQTHLLFWYKSANFDAHPCAFAYTRARAAAVYLLYWYKSTCSSGTKVQILTHTRVQSLIRGCAVRSRRHCVYKSTNSDVQKYKF